MLLVLLSPLKFVFVIIVSLVWYPGLPVIAQMGLTCNQYIHSQLWVTGNLVWRNCPDGSHLSLVVPTSTTQTVPCSIGGNVRCSNSHSSYCIVPIHWSPWVSHQGMDSHLRCARLFEFQTLLGFCFCFFAERFKYLRAY